MKHTQWKRALLSSAGLIALAGCSGGGGDPSPTAVTPPASGGLPADPLASLPATITTTPSALLTYQFLVLQVEPAKADKAEPIDLTDVTLPTSDTSEAADV